MIQHLTVTNKKVKSNYNTSRLTTCGHVKTFSPVIVSTEGSSNAHCLASDTMADTATENSIKNVTRKAIDKRK